MDTIRDIPCRESLYGVDSIFEVHIRVTRGTGYIYCVECEGNMLSIKESAYILLSL